MNAIKFDYTGSTNLTITRGESFEIPKITATDEQDNNVPVDLIIMHNYMMMFDIDTDIEGTYVLVYSAQINRNDPATTLSIYLDVVANARGPMFNWNDQTEHLERCDKFEMPEVMAMDETGFVPVTSIIEFNGQTVGRVNTNRVGTYLLTFKATGANGQTSALRKTIHIGPNTTPPEFDYTGPTIYVIDQNEKFELPTINVTDDVDDEDALEVQVTITRDGIKAFEVDTAISGVYVLTYNANDLDGNEAELIISVIVKQDAIEGTKGVILDGHDDGQTITISRCDEFKLPQAIVEDDGTFVEWSILLNGKPVPKVDTTIAGKYIATCTATDYAGLTSFAYLIIDIHKDTVIPELHYDGPTEFIVGRGEPFTLPEVTATDNLDGVKIATTITYNGARADSIDTSLTGQYIVTYIAIDADDNTSKPIVLNVDIS